MLGVKAMKVKKLWRRIQEHFASRVLRESAKWMSRDVRRNVRRNMRRILGIRRHWITYIAKGSTTWYSAITASWVILRTTNSFNLSSAFPTESPFQIPTRIPIGTLHEHFLSNSERRPPLLKLFPSRCGMLLIFLFIDTHLSFFLVGTRRLLIY